MGKTYGTGCWAQGGFKCGPELSIYYWRNGMVYRERINTTLLGEMVYWAKLEPVH